MAPTFGMATFCREPLIPQLKEARDHGFDYVELDWTGPSDIDRGLKVSLEEIQGPPPRTAHLSDLNREEDLSRALALLEFLSPLGVELVNLHTAGLVGLGPSRRQMDWMKTLVEAARELGVIVTAENTWEGPEAMATILAQIPGLGFCLDLGHANLLTGQYQGAVFLQRLGPRLRLVHVSDNKGGKLDLHIPVGRGTVPFPYVLQRLETSGYNGPITLEIFRAT